MRVEEIAVRQEVRQMLSEAGLNRNTLREMTQQILREEIKKQVKYAVEHIKVCWNFTATQETGNCSKPRCPISMMSSDTN